LFLAGLVPEPMTADDDFKLLHFGIGFTNMVARPTKGSADLTRKEIRDGGRILLEKLQRFRPKIAVFNGKGIYEVFSGKKEFTFGKQPECIDGTNTVMISLKLSLFFPFYLVSIDQTQNFRKTLCSEIDQLLLY
jgi:TDG/mug DNA glycosylase family protein